MHSQVIKWFSLVGFAFFALLCALFSLKVGSVAILWSDLLKILLGEGDPFMANLIWKLRFPRVANGFVTGSALALSGALMQVLLHNPLADPYVLGVSGGAAAMALILIMAGISGTFLDLGAFAGALLSMALVFILARGRGGSHTRMLLTGVVMAAGWGALISFLLAVAPESHLRGMVFWLMGDVGYGTEYTVVYTLLIAAFLIIWPQSRALDLLTRDQSRAAALGVEVERIRFVLFLLSSLLTAGAVMTSGTIGFVGLVTPHLLRLLGFHQHRFLLPASVMFGGTLVMLADTLARTVIAPQQLPVGVITTMVGVPLFLILLKRGTLR
ncbi:FecCD family ABC transporter permease [Magnetococcales bacterium HHB-1]